MIGLGRRLFAQAAAKKLLCHSSERSSNSIRRPPPPQTKAGSVRMRASALEYGAGLFAALGVAAFIFGVTNSGKNHAMETWLGVALIGFALWFYLVSQIIHIRANTEK